MKIELKTGRLIEQSKTMKRIKILKQKIALYRAEFDLKAEKEAKMQLWGLQQELNNLIYI